MRSGHAGGSAPAASSGDTDERWSPTTEELEAWASTVAGLDRSRRLSRLLVIGCVTVGLLAGSGTAAVVSASILTHAPQHVAVNESGPAVPTPTGPHLDMTAPATPPGLRLTSSAVTTVTLDWDSPTDDAGIAGYIVMRDGVQIATTYQPGFTDPNLAPATTYQYSVKAFDAVGNISAASTPVAATTLTAPDTGLPSMPTNLRAVSVSTTSIRISWSPSSDNVGVAGYDIYRNGRFLGSTGKTTFTNTGLSPSTVYRYQIVAFDASNNTSRITAALTVTTQAGPAPIPETIPEPVPVSVPVPVPTPSTAPPTSPQPSPEPPSPTPSYQIVSVALESTVDGIHPACEAHIDVTVTADGPLQAQLNYTVGQTSGSVPLDFTAGTLSQTLRIPSTGDGAMDGAASASAGGKSGSTSWTACLPPSPSPPPPPTASPDEAGDFLEPA